MFKKTPADGDGQIVKPKIRLPILLLVILSGLGPFSMIAVVPLIPAIADSFDTSYGTAQLVLSMYFVIFAVAQLMLGPLSDRFGRKPVLVVALVSYVAGSCACWYAPSIEVTIAGRCLQAVGAAAGQVLTRVVLFDVYGKSRSASLIGYLTIAMVLGPMMAPAIAGFIAEISGWQHMFFLMLLVSLFTLSWLVKSLPETRWIGATPQDRAQGFLDGLPLLKNRDFLALSGTWAFGVGIYFSFLAGAAFVVIEEMGRSEIEYGAYFIGGGICFMFGNLLSARFSARIGLFRFIQYGTALAMVSVLTQWLLIGIEHPLIVFLPMYGVAIANGLVLPNAAAMVMGVVPRLSGAASGLAGFLQIGCGAVVTWLVGHFQFYSSITLIVAMNVCAVLAVICLFLVRKRAMTE
jgi:DHA1 family bicyclomycin/chloramphenicol resistance-like MFS transporter